MCLIILSNYYSKNAPKRFVVVSVCDSVDSDSLPVPGYEILQLQQPVLTVLHHLLCVQMLHQTRQDPAGAAAQTHVKYLTLQIYLHTDLLLKHDVCREQIL